MKQREVGFQDGASEGANTCDLFVNHGHFHVCPPHPHFAFY